MSNRDETDPTCNYLENELFLIKLPKQVAEYWNQVSDGEKVAQIEQLVLKNQMLLETKTKTGANRAYSLNPNKIQHPDSLISTHINGEFKVIGHVNTKIEATPYVENTNNKNTMLNQFVLPQPQKLPQKTVQKLDSVVTGVIKPISIFKEDLEYAQMRKEVGKRVRLERHEVKDIVFQAFNQNSYYRLKDLSEITNQPMDYLKDILRELCNFRTREPYKGMWELKTEYKTQLT